MRVAPLPASLASDLDLRLIAAALDATPDGIGVTDVEGCFVYVNRAHAEGFGYAPNEMLGQPWTILYDPEEGRRIGAAAFPVIAEAGFWRGAATARRRDGSTFPQELVLTQLADGSIFCTSRDVSDRKALEAEARRLAEMRARAEAASAAKSELLAQVSHEVRTPLNAVMGLASVLSREPLNPQQREIVTLIESASAAMERLLGDLLDMSMVEAGKFLLGSAPFDLIGTASEALKIARVCAADHGVVCRLDHTEAARGLFLGDEFRIRQLVLNLVSNAVKFTPRGEVGVFLDAEESEEGCEILIEVRDNGIGLNANETPRLFRPFERGANAIAGAYGGAGLGLSICKALCEAMGGRIEVRSKPNEGATFALRLPMPRAEMFVQDAPERHEPNDAPLRILVAEDHPANRKVVELILQNIGTELTFVGTGVEAVSARRGAQFDLILMDMLMPEMSGLDALRAIRAYESATGSNRTPIAILSAHARENQRVQAFNAGADHYITKPLTAASLIEGVERAIVAGLRKGAG
ncbi:MAG: ATP-binding protein [Hyphomonadaceae bacterium]|nr:ATP-binding protein [Hyphomonadaceae bacterium]